MFQTEIKIVPTVHRQGPCHLLTCQDLNGFDPLSGRNDLGITIPNHPAGEEIARLWAASPKLLEALKEFVAHSECHCTNADGACAHCQGEAAIAMAEGR